MNLPFSDQLVEPIRQGTKIHTFRAGKRWRAGMLIHFYARSRRPDMYLFYPVRPCVSVQDAELTSAGMHVDGRLLEGPELELFAQRDGFATSTDFLAFFEGRPLPIVGQLIHWTPARYDAASVATVAARLTELAAERQAQSA